MMRKTNESATCRAFRYELADAFREQLFSGEWWVPIPPEVIAEYEFRRREASKATFWKDYFVEEELYQALWPTLQPDRPLVILRGDAGCGKSTLLRFFFGFFMQCYDHFQLNGKFPSSTSDEIYSTSERLSILRRMVVLRVNLHTGVVPEQALEDFLRGLRRVIEKRFPSLISDEECAMWNRLVQWERPHHKLVSKDMALSVYRSQLVAKHDSDKEFVREGLWYLSNLREAGGALKHYVCVIVDNLDQVDPVGQEAVVMECLSWLGERAIVARQPFEFDDDVCKICKIVLPLRPETLRNLQHRLDPCTQKRVISAGELDGESALSRRANRLHESVLASHRQVDRAIEMEGFSVFVPMPTVTAAKQIELLVKVRGDQQKGAGENQVAKLVMVDESYVPRYTRPIIEDLCAGSMRRLLVCQHRVARSRAIDEHLADRTSAEDEAVSNYLYIDALLTSDGQTFDAFDEDNYVVNVFNAMKAANPSPHSTLIGSVILDVFLGGSIRRQKLEASLTGIGFLEDEISDTLRAFHSRRLFHYAAFGAGPEYEVIPERRIVTAHISFRANAAYLDNMAQVSPRQLGNKRPVYITVGDRSRDLARRVQTTLGFLSELKTCEGAITTWAGSSRSRPTTWEKFRADFEALRLPSVYLQASKTYAERLREVRERTRGAIRSQLSKYVGQLNVEMANHSATLVAKRGEGAGA